MADIRSGGDLGEVLRFVNETDNPKDLLKVLPLETGERTALALLEAKTDAGGTLSAEGLRKVSALPFSAYTSVAAAIRAAALAAKIEPERSGFKNLLILNPNYFGNLKDSALPPVKVIQGNTAYEELTCVGLKPNFDRLEAIIRIKNSLGYSGGICTPGSIEYVRFFVDLHDNGVFHDAGLASFRAHDIAGTKPLCYAVYKDFSPFTKFCLIENIVRVRAILSWNVPPPPNPGWIPVWGNVLEAQVQIRPKRIFTFGDLTTEFKNANVVIPDPIGPVVKTIDPEVVLTAVPNPPLSVVERKKAYTQAKVPAGRFAFTESLQLVSSDALAGELQINPKASKLAELGLDAADIKNVLEILGTTGDGNVTFEELKCIGIKPELDVIEGVLTVKKSSGYSGGLCSNGSTEYVAFWADFFDGHGFTYLGTSSVQVHDLTSIPADGIRYAVFLKKNLSKYLKPCQLGAKIARLRAILSWEVAPPPGNPNWVPTWGNREECLIQLRPGEGVGHTPLIETVGDVGVNDIGFGNGLANGVMVLAGVSLQDAPFGAGISITGRIGNPPDSFGGGSQQFKYKIDVAPDGTNDWAPLTNKITVKKSEFFNGNPVLCSPFQFICDVTLTPTDDGDGLGPGWYPYIEDAAGPNQRFLVVDLLGRWQTNPNMEGLWKIRITAKDPSTSPPTVYPGAQIVKVRVDNTAPTVDLAITSATLNGNPVPAVECGKFRVGTIIEGTFSVHDPGTVSSAAAFQHYKSAGLSVIPALAGNNPIITTVPINLNYPAIGTTGVSGTWRLDTKEMKPCGYVLRLTGVDRTNYNSQGVNFQNTDDIGFCLE